MCVLYFLFFFFFNDTATTEIYTLSLHDALPISTKVSDVVRCSRSPRHPRSRATRAQSLPRSLAAGRDRKSTRLNSSHSQISYAVFCLKKKKTYDDNIQLNQANENRLEHYPFNFF